MQPTARSQPKQAASKTAKKITSSPLSYAESSFSITTVSVLSKQSPPPPPVLQSVRNILCMLLNHVVSHLRISPFAHDSCPSYTCSSISQSRIFQTPAPCQSKRPVPRPACSQDISYWGNSSHKGTNCTPLKRLGKVAVKRVWKPSEGAFIYRINQESMLPLMTSKPRRHASFFAAIKLAPPNALRRLSMSTAVSFTVPQLSVSVLLYKL